jgi:hypothetical protein
VDLEALPQGPSKAILLRALDDLIAEIVFREGKIRMTGRRRVREIVSRENSNR